jgi:hypothetical protein
MKPKQLTLLGLLTVAFLATSSVRLTADDTLSLFDRPANRQHPYGKDLMLGGLAPYYKDLKAYYDESQPMQLGLGRQGEGMKGNGWRLIPPNIVHSADLPDDRYTTIRARIWLDRGTVPYLA